MPKSTNPRPAWSLKKSLSVSGPERVQSFGIDLDYVGTLAHRRLERDPAVSILAATAEELAKAINHPEAAPSLQEELLRLFPGLAAGLPFSLARTVAPAADRADIVVGGVV